MENTKTAILVMDMQLSILGSLTEKETLIGNTARAIKAAREQQIPIIYVVVGFRQGIPEVGINNKVFSEFKKSLLNMDMQDWVKIHPGVAPQDGDIIITKRRFSAFTGSDLEVVLRGQGIQHLILTGVSTSGVVLSTLREAADKDYLLTVISDCCADHDEEVHRVLMTKIFPRQANVVPLIEWI
nr:isochorismatase family cysteine hydrolase [Pedobacter panaciterrae]